MMNKINSMYLRGKIKLQSKFAEWKEEERGASDIVAIIVVIVIIIAVAAIFKDQLIKGVTSGMKKFTEFTK